MNIESIKELLSQIEGVTEYALFKEDVLVDTNASLDVLNEFRKYISAGKLSGEYLVDKEAKILLYKVGSAVLAFKYNVQEGWVIFQLRKLLKHAPNLDLLLTKSVGESATAKIMVQETETVFVEKPHIEEFKGELELYKNSYGTLVKVSIPLEDKVDLSRCLTELGLPDYVKPLQFPYKRTIATVWLASKASKLAELFPNITENQFKRDFKALVGGDVAFKILSPSLNDEQSPFFQPIRDAFFVVSSKQAKDFIKFLQKIRDFAGDAYTYFITEEDRLFSKLSFLQGISVYKLTTIDGLEKGKAKLNIVEVYPDKITRNHVINCKEAIDNVSEYHYCLPREEALIEKLSKISVIDDKAVLSMKDEDKLSIIGVAPYDPHKILIGMDYQDMLYCYALINDSCLGSGWECINFRRFNAILRKDLKLATTVVANLKNLLERVEILKERGVNRNSVESIKTKISRLLVFTPEIRKKWKSPWWTKIES